MQLMQHKNVLRHLNIFDDEKHYLYLELEYVVGGAAMEWDSEAKKYMYHSGSHCGPMPRNIAQELTAGVVVGLRYIHLQGVCHRDIKPENVLLHHDTLPNGASRLVPKIADFGVSCEVLLSPSSVTGRPTTEGHIFDHQGTSAFMAPEMFLGRTFAGTKTDIWSLGVTVYNFVTQLMPEWATELDFSRFEALGAPVAEIVLEIDLAKAELTQSRAEQNLPPCQHYQLTEGGFSPQSGGVSAAEQLQEMQLEEQLEGFVEQLPGVLSRFFEQVDGMVGSALAPIKQEEPVLADLLRGLLQADPEARFRLKQAAESAWLNPLLIEDWNALRGACPIEPTETQIEGALSVKELFERVRSKINVLRAIQSITPRSARSSGDTGNAATALNIE